MVKYCIKDDTTYDNRSEKLKIFQSIATGVGSTPTKQSDPLYSHIKYLYTEIENHENGSITKDTKAHEENITCVSSPLEFLHENEEDELVSKCSKKCTESFMCRHNAEAFSPVAKLYTDLPYNILIDRNFSLTSDIDRSKQNITFVLPDSDAKQFKKEMSLSNCKHEMKWMTVEELKYAHGGIFSGTFIDKHGSRSPSTISGSNKDSHSSYVIVHDLSPKRNITYILPGTHAEQFKREFHFNNCKDETQYMMQELEKEQNNTFSEPCMFRPNNEMHSSDTNLNIDLQSSTSIVDDLSPKRNITYILPGSHAEQLKRKFQFNNCKDETQYKTQEFEIEKNNTFSEPCMCRPNTEINSSDANLNIDLQSSTSIVHDLSPKRNITYILPGTHAEQFKRKFHVINCKDETQYMTQELEVEQNDTFSEPCMCRPTTETHSSDTNLNIDLQSSTSIHPDLGSKIDTDIPRQNITSVLPDLSTEQSKRKTLRSKDRLKRNALSNQRTAGTLGKQAGERSIHETPKRIFAKMATGNKKLKRKTHRLTIPSTKIRNIAKEFGNEEKSLDNSHLQSLIPESVDKTEVKLQPRSTCSGIKRLISYLEKSSVKKDENLNLSSRDSREQFISSFKQPQIKDNSAEERGLSNQVKSRIHKDLKKELMSEVDNKIPYTEFDFKDYINKLIRIQTKEPSTKRSRAFAEKTTFGANFNFNDYCQKIFDLKEKFSKV